MMKGREMKIVREERGMGREERKKICGEIVKF